VTEVTDSVQFVPASSGSSVPVVPLLRRGLQSIREIVSYWETELSLPGYKPKSTNRAEYLLFNKYERVNKKFAELSRVLGREEAFGDRFFFKDDDCSLPCSLNMLFETLKKTT